MPMLTLPVTSWHPSSWRSMGKHAYQQFGDWSTHSKYGPSMDKLSSLPPLVSASGARSLTDNLAKVCQGEAFLLQAGDCAESFDTSTDSIMNNFRVVLQMAIILTYAAGVPIVKVGRVAGQFAKPRTSPTETRDGTTLSSFMGHMINDDEFTEKARTPNPKRILTAYYKAATTLNFLRALSQGGYSDLNRVAFWNREFAESSPATHQYLQLATEIDKALAFMKACGLSSDHIPQLHTVDFFSSHESLVLDYEEALTREDSTTGDWYDCSAHMVWLGSAAFKAFDKVADNPHVEFLRGINNPIGCKIAHDDSHHKVVDLCDALNPSRAPGKLTLIIRMGATKIKSHLPPLLHAVSKSGHPVVWVSDPMHGNTYKTTAGVKTRDLETVLKELELFFDIHATYGTRAGGVHLELTGDDVTECTGGPQELTENDLQSAFRTLCDPRLNAEQSIELAFRIAEMIRR